MPNIYTRGGDKGQTSLVGGSRVSKGDLRVECYGTLDEANSMMGLGRAQTDDPYIQKTLKSIQGRIFSAGAELASDEQGKQKLTHLIGQEDISFLEGIVDYCTETNGPQTAFVIPGEDAASGALHVARTMVRRAERNMVRLSAEEPLREELVRYVNRLSDAVYALARLQETRVQQARTRETVTELVSKLLRERGFSMPPFTLEHIQRMAARAQEKATEMGVPVVFAAVDEGGNTILLQRMPDSLLGSVDIALNKAYTANAFKMPTHELGKLAQPGGPLFAIEESNNGRVVLFGGGFPYQLDGKTVGAIGISGGSVEEDMAIAQYALNQALGGKQQ